MVSNSVYYEHGEIVEAVPPTGEHVRSCGLSLTFPQRSRLEAPIALHAESCSLACRVPGEEREVLVTLTLRREHRAYLQLMTGCTVTVEARPNRTGRLTLFMPTFHKHVMLLAAMARQQLAGLIAELRARGCAVELLETFVASGVEGLSPAKALGALGFAPPYVEYERIVARAGTH